jgi:hypothetical protein
MISGVRDHALSKTARRFGKCYSVSEDISCKC